MAQDVAPVDPNTDVASDAAADRGLIAALGSLGPGRIVALGIVTVLLLGFFAYIIFRATTPNYDVLFSGLSLDEAQAISEQLQSSGVSYKVGGQGNAILVPKEEVLRLRMELASDGLPTGSTVGYELFDESSSLTATDFISNVNLRRALEGELARTIASLRQVRTARVHIVSPNRQPFSRSQNEPTASVVVGTSSLDKRQIDGIRHLVASAVPGLSASAVSVIDDNGNLLASPDDDQLATFGLRQEEQRVALENRLRTKIISLLERSVGRGRIDAQVFAEMDFDTLTTTTEEFDPESQVARSIQTIEETTDRNETEPNDAVTVANNLPAEGDAAAAGATSNEQANRTEESTNFEISRTVQSQSRVGGVVDRLSVAVQVDFLEVTDAQGNVTRQARTPEDLEQIEALVRSAVGFDEERGDWIEVVSREFAPDEIIELEEPSLFEFGKEDIWRAAELLVLLLLGTAGVLFGVKPLLSYSFGIGKKPEDDQSDQNIVDGILDANGNPIPLLEDGSGGEMDVLEEEDDLDEFVNVTGVDGKVKASLVDKVSEIIEKNPDAGVRVLRSWLHGV